MNNVKAVVFDLYGTLVNIKTDEQDPELYAQLSKFLSYNRVTISPDELQSFYVDEIKRQLQNKREEYPEVDVLKIFRVVVRRYGHGRNDPRLPVNTARLFRSLSRKTFEPFPRVYGMLERLRDIYPLALLSDAQRCFTEPEIEMLKLSWFFDHIFISSDYGFRKPDPRYFGMAIDALGVKPEEAVYVGDNPYRDLFGARKAGMRMVLVRNSDREYEGCVPDEYVGDVADIVNVLDVEK